MEFSGLTPILSSPWWALLGLFVAAFVSATLFPASSEGVFLLVLYQYPAWAGFAWMVATLGNTLGGMSSYGLGRLAKPLHWRQSSMQQYLQRHGSVLLMLSWLPVIGDGLCLGAGWLRLKWWPVLVFMACGKALRYALLWYGFVTITS